MTSITVNGRSRTIWPIFPADRQHRQERGDRRQGRCEHGRKHDRGRRHRRFFRRHAMAVQHLGMFTDDDGVIHDDAETQYDREHAHEVQRHAEHGHAPETCEDGNRDTHGDPERDAPVEKNEQNDQDERQTADAVRDEHLYALSRLVRQHVKHFDAQ